MVSRNMFSIVVFAVLCLHAITAQDANETSISTPLDNSTENTAITSTTTITTTITTTTPVCENSNEVPLFGKNSCISRPAYTGIFLTSIILAGISFLMLIGLLILYCIRQSRGSGSSYGGSSSRSSISSGSSDDNEPSVIKRDGQRSNVIQDGVAGRTPLDNPRQKKADNQYITVDLRDVPATSAAPYTDTTPVSKTQNRPRPPPAAQTKVPIPKASNDLEMSARPNNRPPPTAARTKASALPYSAANQGGRSDNRRKNNDAQNDDQMSSQF